MKKYSIIGNGIAGLSLAWRMYQEGVDFQLVSNQGPKSSSLAAGIINPVTGRKFAMSWNYDELHKDLVEFYGSLPFDDPFQSMPIYRGLNNPEIYNEYTIRKTELEDSGYTKEHRTNEQIENHYSFKSNAWIEMSKGGRLDTNYFINNLTQFFMDKGLFVESNIERNDIVIQDNAVLIDKLDSEQYIFSEGIPIPLFTLFKELPIIPVKGEVLLFESNELPNNFIIKYKYFIVPVGENRFWLGSNYDRNPKYLFPSESKYNEMESFLATNLNVKYKIIQHSIGYRPTMKDRMPILGRLDGLEKAIFYNGLGSKGSSLAPHSSKILLDNIINGTPIEKELNINRILEGKSENFVKF